MRLVEDSKMKTQSKSVPVFVAIAFMTFALVWMLNPMAQPTNAANPNLAPEAAAPWTVQGNSISARSFLGTTNNKALIVKVNNQRVLKLEPKTTSPNIIGGYKDNVVTSGAYGATIGGGGAAGWTNGVTDNYGTVGGGYNNQAGNNNSDPADASYATVGGGISNKAAARYTVIGGGFYNTASGDYATVAGGNSNTANNSATVGGGYSNNADGFYAAIPGGYDNGANGYYSFAAGRRAKASNQGCFVWGDATDADITCNTDNRWRIRASGGVYFYSSSDLSTGSYLAAGSGSWSSVSDRQLKNNFAPTDGREVLARLTQIPIATWNYKTQDASIRHIGPTAQDFYTAFAVGEDDTHISTVDADGVALAAIQGLYETVREKDKQIAALETRVAALEKGTPRETTANDDSLAFAVPFSIPLASLLTAAALATGVGLGRYVQRKKQK